MCHVGGLRHLPRRRGCRHIHRLLNKRVVSVCGRLVVVGLERDLDLLANMRKLKMLDGPRELKMLQAVTQLAGPCEMTCVRSAQAVLRACLSTLVAICDGTPRPAAVGKAEAWKTSACCAITARILAPFAPAVRCAERRAASTGRAVTAAMLAAPAATMRGTERATSCCHPRAPLMGASPTAAVALAQGRCPYPSPSVAALMLALCPGQVPVQMAKRGILPSAHSDAAVNLLAEERPI
mmetsp:Transcript_7978/g.15735  ORF Transcript_7978/g.15735 Transcript_7978/m.15735 type:complete len:238 (+) Transcript_7978:287-1000(+)